MSELDTCPKCGGPADNGNDRCVPPSPYICSRCQAESERDYYKLLYEDAIKQADRLREHAAQHPFGECTCHGEGQCGWCERQAALEAMAHRDLELVVKQIKQLLRRQLGEMAPDKRTKRVLSTPLATVLLSEINLENAARHIAAGLGDFGRNDDD